METGGGFSRWVAGEELEHTHQEFRAMRLIDQGVQMERAWWERESQCTWKSISMIYVQTPGSGYLLFMRTRQWGTQMLSSWGSSWSHFQAVKQHKGELGTPRPFLISIIWDAVPHTVQQWERKSDKSWIVWCSSRQLKGLKALLVSTYSIFYLLRDDLFLLFYQWVIFLGIFFWIVLLCLEST